MGCVPGFRHETGEEGLCLTTPYTEYYSRRCRMTIWPDSTWDKKPEGMSTFEWMRKCEVAEGDRADHEVELAEMFCNILSAREEPCST